MYTSTGADLPATFATVCPRWRIHLFPLLFLYFNSPVTSFGTETNLSSHPLKIGFTDLPPVSVVNDIDPIGGYSAIFLRKLLSLIGVNFSFVGYPMKRLKASLENGTTNIWLGPKEVENVVYGEKSIFSLSLSIFSAKKRPAGESAFRLERSPHYCCRRPSVWQCWYLCFRSSK
ncbi:hypothetical protein [Undibacterium sp. TJN19]|uniref:hypothetical protein n=1 Tax=Undibacterium sp. TJN19 TaxID=3413055 RepID=UPI003BF60946